VNPGSDAAQWYANDIAIWALIASAIGLAVNACIAYFAVTQTKAARASAEAASNSVKVAQQSIEQGRTALETGSRAWVHVNKLVDHDSTAEEASRDREVSIARDVILRNFGQTPASSLTAECRMLVVNDLPTTAELQFTPSNKSVSVLSPGSDFWVVPTAIMRFKFNEWPAITEGKRKLLLYGEAHYQDIFGNAHRSTWLYFWDATAAGGFIQGPLHNQAT
jgi:hypothetical protein